jgi:hypothetical protein
MKIRVIECDSALSKAVKYQRLPGLGLLGISAFVAVVGLAFPGTVCGTRAAPDLTITVRVYKYTQASPAVLAGAEREAGQIFAKAGLNVVWSDCWQGLSTNVSQEPCDEATLEATGIRLRILPTPVENSFQDSVFGFAIAPALATVYYESALGFAKYDQADFEAPIVLGCAIAHEIGHLLLGPNRHAVSGIMRARWEREHIRQALMGAMLFTSEQARLMQAEMQRRMMLMTSGPTNGAHHKAR